MPKAKAEEGHTIGGIVTPGNARPAASAFATSHRPGFLFCSPVSGVGLGMGIELQSRRLHGMGWEWPCTRERRGKVGGGSRAEGGKGPGWNPSAEINGRACRENNLKYPGRRYIFGLTDGAEIGEGLHVPGRYHPVYEVTAASPVPR